MSAWRFRWVVAVLIVYAFAGLVVGVFDQVRYRVGRWVRRG